MDRIPFEEWALKTIEPSLVPNPVQSSKSLGTTDQARRENEEKRQRVRPQNPCVQNLPFACIIMAYI